MNRRRGIFLTIKENIFVSSSIVYILSTFLVTGISFITTPIFTRLMGTADYGIVSNFTIWVHIFAIFICLQVSSGLLPAKVNYATTRFHSYMKSIIIFGTIVALLEISIVLLCSKTIAEWIKLDVKIIPLLCIASFGTAITNICTSYFVATNSPKNKAIFSIITASLTIGFGLLFVFLMSNKGVGRIIGYCVSNAFIIIFGFIVFFRKPNPTKEQFQGDIKYALAYGVPLIPHLLANLVNGSADRVFIIRILGESQAGIYSVAYSIGQIGLVLASACADAWNPWYFHQTKKGTKQSISQYFRLYSLTIGMCFVGIMFLAPDVMKIMAPSEYWTGTRCILFVALGIFFLFMYRFPLGYEQFMSNTKFIAPTTVLAAVINIGLNALLIPKYGIIAAALTTTLSYIVLWLSHELVARRFIKGYNIGMKHYLLPMITVISGFVISNILLNHSYLRFCVLAAYCIAYLFVVRALVNKQIMRK